jgi:hypothetical protein
MGLKDWLVEAYDDGSIFFIAGCLIFFGFMGFAFVSIGKESNFQQAAYEACLKDGYKTYECAGVLNGNSACVGTTAPMGATPSR